MLVDSYFARRLYYLWGNGIAFQKIRLLMSISAAGSAKNLAKALALLHALAAHGEVMKPGDLSRAAGVPKPTAHRLLRVLAESGMVREEERGTYGLGPQCLVLGGAFLDGLDLRREAREVMEEIFEKTGETCHLGIRDKDRVVYIEKVEGPQMVQLRSRVGLTAPPRVSALGKALLAHCADAEVDKVLERGAERRTEHTIVDPQTLRSELAEVRRRGFAVDDMESEERIRCVASPVFDHTQRTVASLSVSGPEYRMPLECPFEAGGLVREAALNLSQKMGFRYDVPDSEEVIREMDLV